MTDGHTHPTESCALVFSHHRGAIHVASTKRLLTLPADKQAILVADVVHHDVSVHILPVPEQTI
jgi:hypothetical protein